MDNQDYFEPYAYKLNGLWYCADCLRELFYQEDTTIENLIEFADATINENTVQYEQYMGELIPNEGVYCSHCDSELYPSLEEY